MAAQDVLHLLRVDVEATADDQLLDPADDAQVPRPVVLAEVAGTEPAVGGERLRARLRPPPVAGEHVRSARLDLPPAAARQADLHARQRQAHRARPALPVVW